MQLADSPRPLPGAHPTADRAAAAHPSAERAAAAHPTAERAAAAHPTAAVPDGGEQVRHALAAFVWPVLPAVVGVHSLQPVAGPVGPAGWPRSAAGALLCRWSCATCGKAATNSSRLFELLRSPCGAPGEWRQLRHSVVVADGKAICTRCGTTRQQHVQLGSQKCPVRVHFQGGAEVPAATAVYAAWQRTVSAMHACTKAAAFGLGAPVSAADAPAEARAAAAEPEAVIELAPRRVTLRPFRSHACFKVAEVEACMMCFMRAPRYRIPAWRAECCDGRAPIGACPKHILAAIMTSATVWPAGHEARGRDPCCGSEDLQQHPGCEGASAAETKAAQGRTCGVRVPRDAFDAQPIRALSSDSSCRRLREARQEKGPGGPPGGVEEVATRSADS
jgi:hypothetical protein